MTAPGMDCIRCTGTLGVRRVLTKPIVGDALLLAVRGALAVPAGS